MTREEWLYAVADTLATWPEYPTFEHPVRIGVGFTSKGARSKRIGECWSATCSADQARELFIHPGLSDPLEVAATLAHELIHAALPDGTQHGAEFKRVALGIGLEGRMTATVPGAGFKARVEPVLAAVGPYPHGALTAGGTSSTGPKQSTRMIRCQCPIDGCGYTLRTTRKWLDAATPTCPICDVLMTVAA